MTKSKARGTKAFQELLPNCPELKDFESYHDTVLAKIENVKSAIRANRVVRSYLARLEDRGFKSERIVHVLALEVRRSSQLRTIQRKKRNLKSLSRRVRTLAGEIERTYGEAETWPDVWRVCMQLDSAGPVVSPSDRVPHPLISEMGTRADQLDDLSRNFGVFAKEYGPIERRKIICALLAEVYGVTKDIPQNLPLIASMLNEVYATFKIQRTVSPGMLEKLFMRYVNPNSPRSDFQWRETSSKQSKT